jgi:hypothetical protein
MAQGLVSASPSACQTQKLQLLKSVAAQVVVG